MNTATQIDRWGRAAVTVVVLTLGSLVMLVVALVTGFRARRLYTETMAAAIGRWLLSIWGVRVRAHDRPTTDTEQRVYISNHTSTLDMFVLIGLALPNTRFFLSGYLRKLLPLGLIGYLTGVIWTVPQEFPQRRVAIFKRAERILRRTGESVYLSPEGHRVTSGEIGPFNKGAFHLAVSLGAPIIPLFIFIPPQMDPGKGLFPTPGYVDVYFEPAFDTSEWRIEDLVANKDRVREQFVKWHREYHCT